MSNGIMRYIGGQTNIVFNTHKLLLFTVTDRKLNFIAFNCVDQFHCTDVRFEILLCKKCEDNYNEGVVNKVSKIANTNDDPKAIPLLQIPVAILCPYLVCHNHTDYDRYLD